MKLFDGDAEDRIVKDSIVLRTPGVKGVRAGVGYVDIEALSRADRGS